MVRSTPHSRPWIEKSDMLSINQALSDNMIANGARVKAFENAVDSLLVVRGGIACTSGTTALNLALKVLSSGPGD